MVFEIRGFTANRIWSHRQSFARGRCAHFFMTESERSIMASWECSTVTFNLRCEITRCYCKPDRTSSWFHRQGALHSILHDGFWKSEHDSMIMFHGNFLSGMHSFRDNEVLLLTGYDIIVSLPSRGTAHTFSRRFLKKRPWFLIVFYSNVLT